MTTIEAIRAAQATNGSPEVKLTVRDLRFSSKPIKVLRVYPNHAHDVFVWNATPKAKINHITWRADIRTAEYADQLDRDFVVVSP